MSGAAPSLMPTPSFSSPLVGNIEKKGACPHCRSAGSLGRSSDSPSLPPLAATLDGRGGAGATTPTFGLTGKPFGKDGVRVLYTGGAAGTVLEVSPTARQLPPPPLQPAATATRMVTMISRNSRSRRRRRSPRGCTPTRAAGAIIVAGRPPPRGARAPRTAVAPALCRWQREQRCPARGSVAIGGVFLVVAARGLLAPIKALDDAELAFNVLQWFGTVAGPPQWRKRWRGHNSSNSTPSRASSASMGAAGVTNQGRCVAIGAPPDVLNALAARRGAVHVLLGQHPRGALRPAPCLPAAAEDSEAAPGTAAAVAVKRPVLPNLVDGALLVGHQGRALHRTMGCPHTARRGHQPRRRPRRPDAGAGGGEGGGRRRMERDGVEVPTGRADGQARRRGAFLEVLPKALDAIRAGTAGGRLVFIHCQQGARAPGASRQHICSRRIRRGRF